MFKFNSEFDSSFGIIRNIQVYEIVIIKGINHQLFKKDINRMIRYDQKNRTLKNLENDGNQA